MAIVVVILVFIALGFFQREIRRVTDNTILEDDRDVVSDVATTTEEGLVIEDTIEGGGEEAGIGDTVTVHYIGKLSNGTAFDSSIERGEPFTFTLGEGRVIQGWEQGVLGMNEGGVRMLTIPPELGYGSQAVGSIPPNSTLHFEVRLLEIQ